MAAIGGTILSITEVVAQSTVDDSASCESSSLEEAVDLIKEGMNNVGLIREDMKAVNVIREDLGDVRNVLASNQIQQNNASSSFNEAVNRIREDLEGVKNILASILQQNNATFVTKQEFENSGQTLRSNQDAASLLLCEYRIRDRCFL